MPGDWDWACTLAARLPSFTVGSSTRSIRRTEARALSWTSLRCSRPAPGETDRFAALLCGNEGAIQMGALPINLVLGIQAAQQVPPEALPDILSPPALE